jgi:hypothetical protein
MRLINKRTQGYYWVRLFHLIHNLIEYELIIVNRLIHYSRTKMPFNNASERPTWSQ